MKVPAHAEKKQIPVGMPSKIYLSKLFYYFRRILIWQYLQEEYQRQEEIRDVTISGRCLHPQSKSALSVVNTRDVTDFALSAVITTAVRL